MSRMLLIGKEPEHPLGFSYVQDAPYDGIVIGSLTVGQLLRFREERVLDALAQGKTVYLYVPGIPEVPKNRAMAASLAAAQSSLAAAATAQSEADAAIAILTAEKTSLEGSVTDLTTQLNEANTALSTAQYNLTAANIAKTDADEAIAALTSEKGPVIGIFLPQAVRPAGFRRAPVRGGEKLSGKVPQLRLRDSSLE